MTDPNITLTYIAFWSVSALIAIYALIQRHRADKFARQIAENQGVFRKPNIEINPYSISDPKSADFIFAAPLFEGEIFEFPFQIDVRNTGEKTSEDVEVFIRTNKLLLYGGVLELTWDTAGPKRVKASKASESGPLITLSIQLESIHPSQIINLNGVLSIRSSTFIRRRVPVTTKDGVHLSVGYLFQYNYPMDIVVFQKDQQSVSKRLRIRIVDIAEETPMQFFEELNRDLIANSRDNTPSVGLVGRLRRFFDGRNRLKHVTLLVVDQSKTELTVIGKGENKIGVRRANAATAYDGIEGETGFWFPALQKGK